MDSPGNVVSAKMVIESLNTKLTQREYDIMKMFEWVKLIRGYTIPIKWYKRSSKGTPVLFRPILTEDDVTNAMQDLVKYMAEVNKTYEDEDKQYLIQLMPLRIEEETK